MFYYRTFISNNFETQLTIEDLYGSAEIIVFEPTYLKAQNVLVEENIVMIEGRLSIREDDATKIVAREIKNFGDVKPKMLTLNITNATELLITEIIPAHQAFAVALKYPMQTVLKDPNTYARK